MARHGPRKPPPKTKPTLANMLGVVIHELRVTADLTQAEAASRAALAQSVWSRMESGQLLTFESLQSVAKALDTSLSKLLAKAEKKLAAGVA